MKEYYAISNHPVKTLTLEGNDTESILRIFEKSRLPGAECFDYKRCDGHYALHEEKETFQDLWNSKKFCYAIFEGQPINAEENIIVDIFRDNWPVALIEWIPNAI